MLQYDFTQTALFDCASREELPTEAELFVLTVAMLLIRDIAYSDLARVELQFSRDDHTALVECIAYRLAPLLRDFKNLVGLQERLPLFVGLRIGTPSSEPAS